MPHGQSSLEDWGGTVGGLGARLLVCRTAHSLGTTPSLFRGQPLPGPQVCPGDPGRHGQRGEGPPATLTASPSSSLCPTPRGTTWGSPSGGRAGPRPLRCSSAPAHLGCGTERGLAQGSGGLPGLSMDGCGFRPRTPHGAEGLGAQVGPGSLSWGWIPAHTRWL